MTICSSSFAGLGQAQAKALGHPELPLAVIPHPFGARTRDEIRNIAATCVDDIARLLCESVSANVATQSSAIRRAPRAALVDAPEDHDGIFDFYLLRSCCQRSCS